MSFKVFYEKFLTARKVDRMHVEIFENPSKAEIMGVIQNEPNREAKMFYDIATKKLYLQSTPQAEHIDVADSIGIHMTDIIHLYISTKIRRISIYSIAADNGYDVPQEGYKAFQDNVLPKLERFFPGFEMIQS
jgi:hypothetical protein